MYVRGSLFNYWTLTANRMNTKPKGLYKPTRYTITLVWLGMGSTRYYVSSLYVVWSNCDAIENQRVVHTCLWWSRTLVKPRRLRNTLELYGKQHDSFYDQRINTLFTIDHHKRFGVYGRIMNHFLQTLSSWCCVPYIKRDLYKKQTMWGLQLL